MTQTPIGRLIKQSGNDEDRPALFAAQFSLSHACWLITYPLTGWAGARLGLSPTFFILSVIAGMALLACSIVWRREHSDQLLHNHNDLSVWHPHFIQYPAVDRSNRLNRLHRHHYVIDHLHRVWPKNVNK